MFNKILNSKNVAIIDPVNKKEYSYNFLKKFKRDFEKNIKDKSIILLSVSNDIFSIFYYISIISSKKRITLILLNDNVNEEFFKKNIFKYKPKYVITKKKIKVKDYSIKKKLSNYFFFENKTISNSKINFQNKLLIPTSGTTGSSKMVRLSLSNLSHNSFSIIKSLNIKKSDTAITTMPMSYSYGLSIINTHLLAGAKIIVNKESITSKVFWDYIGRYKVSSLNGVPKFYEYLYKLKFHNFKTPYLKYITQAGGYLDLKLKKYLLKLSHKKKFNFFVMYGLTEASPRVSVLNVKKYNGKIKSVGKPIKGVKLKIKKNKSKSGFIVIYGKNVCLGYSDKYEDLNKANENNFKFISSDIGRLDEDNFLYILKRSNRISKIFGLRIDLSDIEKTLKKNNIEVVCSSDDQFIKIKTSKKNRFDKILDIIKKNYGINKNYIKLTKQKINTGNKYSI